MAEKREEISELARITGVQGGVVRIKVPAEVAFKLDAFQKMLGNLAERLGCRPCLSGRACLFTLESAFVVNPETLKVEPQPDPWIGGVALGGV